MQQNHKTTKPHERKNVMQNYISILSALPVRTVKPLTLPPAPSDLSDIPAVLAYSAKCLQAKTDWEKENSIDPATDVAIACAHLLATLPIDKVGSAAEDAARRAYALAGLATVTKAEFSRALVENDADILAPFAQAFALSSPNVAKESKTLSEAMREAKLAPAAQQMFRGVLADNLSVERAPTANALKADPKAKPTVHTVKDILTPLARKWAIANKIPLAKV